MATAPSVPPCREWCAVRCPNRCHPGSERRSRRHASPSGRAAIERRSSAFHLECHARSDRGSVALCQREGTSARRKGTKPPPAAHIPPSQRKSPPGVANSVRKIEERSPATWHGQSSTDGHG